MAAQAGDAVFAEIDGLAASCPPEVAVRPVGEVELDGRRVELLSFSLGPSDPALPGFGVFGGVHGLERIGVEVALAFLRTLLARWAWDDSLHDLLRRVRVVVMPLVNPGGLLRGTRANPAGVDLMRNAPVECRHGALWGIGGQRVSPGLPWYRGPADAPMQAEARALCRVVEQELMGRPLAISVDCHSGFGLEDRLWFPHAHTPTPIEHLPELHALARLLDGALPHHRYRFEPQSLQYLAHGDLWDHLYLQALRQPGSTLLPLTLEMGSWLWVKKNPRQAFSRHGIFNPLIAHRQQRVLRRHLALLDHLMRAAASQHRWQPAPLQREAARQAALQHWYGGRP
jgi:Zinc carboxypeptidase